MFQGQHCGGRIHIVNAVHSPILGYSFHIHFMTSYIIVFWINHIAAAAVIVIAVRRPVIVMEHINHNWICSFTDAAGDDGTIAAWIAIDNATVRYIGHVFG